LKEDLNPKFQNLNPTAYYTWLSCFNKLFFHRKCCSRNNNIGFIIALAASSALGATNAKHTVDYLNKVRASIIKANDAMEGWNGGLMGAIPVAHSVYSAQKSAEGARNNLGDTDPFKRDDKHQVMHAYKRLQPDFINALRTAEKKVYPRPILYSAFTA
jgi:hypothetical protein